MENKIILITGATSGIGKIAAFELAKTGATIIIHGRNLNKTEKIKNQIIESTGNSKIDMVLADLTLMKSTKIMADEIKAKYERIDVLINNAGGIMGVDRDVSVEGIEKTFALNVVAPYILSVLLFDLLKKSDEAKVITTSSMAHNYARPNFSDFQSQQKYTAMSSYSDAKLHVILLSAYFNKLLKSKNINNINFTTFHPGVVATNFAKDVYGGFMSFFFKVFRPFLLSPEKGADTMIFLAKNDLSQFDNSLYFVKRKPVKPRQKYLNETNEHSLIYYLEQLTKFKIEI